MSTDRIDTEIGLLPKDWSVEKLRTCLSAPPDYGINAAATQFSERHPAYVRITDISDDGRFAPASPVSVNHPLAAEYYLREGDLVFARTGASVGKCYQYDIADGRLVFAGFLIRVAPNRERLLPEFLSTYVRTPQYWKWVRLMSMRSGQPGINGIEYGQLFIPLPSVPEQHAIAEALGDVDALLASLDKLIAKKRDLKQAAMQQLLTGQTRLPGFSSAWTTTKFGALAAPRSERIDPRTTGTHSFCVELEHLEPETARLIGSTAASVQSSLKSVFRPGDVLFGKLRAYLRKSWLADRAGVCSTEIWVLRGLPGGLVPEYLAQLVRTDAFVDVASTAYGTHMPRSDWGLVKNYELRIPEADEQRAIGAALTDMDMELNALDARREKTRLLKQGMMQELLTGRTRLV